MFILLNVVLKKQNINATLRNLWNGVTVVINSVPDLLLLPAKVCVEGSSGSLHVNLGGSHLSQRPSALFKPKIGIFGDW